jgi:hypothetical protein
MIQSQKYSDFGWADNHAVQGTARGILPQLAGRNYLGKMSSTRAMW